MTDFHRASIIGDLIRTILSTVIDRPAFFLLSIMYEIFFNVSGAELFTSATIRGFYYRIQLILAVFMIFKLSISILEAIITPEKVTAKKTGTVSIIGRIFISLLLLAILTPINIPSPQNEYEKQLNNNGLLFGTLYSLQGRILSNNTLGRLILGTTDTAVNNSTQMKGAGRAADIFSSTILKAFVRVNVVPKDQWAKGSELNPEADPRNWVCTDLGNSPLYDEYNKVDADPQFILTLINHTCTTANTHTGWKKIISIFQGASQKLVFADNYAFSYSPLGGIVAFVFAFILVGYTVDIAIRAVKLAVLRLIAPIPIISYMSPSSDGKDVAFQSWVKSLISTYLDLFIRLAVIYFVIYLIQDIIVNGISIETTQGHIGAISFVFICLGLFFFAKQAPKFIKDAIGVKGPGASNIGLSAMLAGIGTLTTGGTVTDALDASRNASKVSIEAYNQGKAAPTVFASYNSGRDLTAQMITGDPKMTYDIMRLGRRGLAQEGITPENADAVHKAALNAVAWTEKMKQDLSGNRLQYIDPASGRLVYYKYKDEHGNVVDADTLEKLSWALEQQEEISSTLQAKDNKIDAEIKKYGLGRSYRDKKRRDPLNHPTSTYHQYRADRHNTQYNSGPDGGNIQAGIDITEHY